MAAYTHAPVQFGMRPSHGFYHRHAFVAFSAAVDFHLLVIAVYCFVFLLSDPERLVSVNRNHPSWIPFSPSWTGKSLGDLTRVIIPPTKIGAGEPVPIPDPIANPEKALPAKQEDT